MQNISRLLRVWILVLSCIFKFSEACECGQSPTNRIIKGHAVSSSDFPWMGRLYRVKHDLLIAQCGASMISSLYAITAGHCLENSPEAKYYLLFGDGLITSGSQLRGEIQNVEGIIVKGRFPLEDDIALVKLKRDVNVMPICLPQAGDLFVDVKATMLGYGQTESGRVSKNLLAGSFDVPSNARCSKFQAVDSSIICGGNFNGDPAMCSGDSGGPLMYLNKALKRWILIGVVSGSYGCDEKDSFGLFTRVSSYLPWIKENSNNAGCQIPAN